MDIRPIKTEADCRATLQEIEVLMRAEPGSAEGERLDVLVALVAAYEQQHFILAELPAE
jgi:HTH-type transcriptional regulator/antitoxin HigA